jgi:CRP/FNR family transcriptional regulator, cyclic AMP receptor protein
VRRSKVQEHLANVPLFATCSKRDRGIIARHAEEVTLRPGSVLIEEGDTGDAFYVVVDGEATVQRNGRRITTLRPGDYFGELALLDAAPRNATVVADGPVTVAVLGARVFSVLLKELPNMSDKLLRGMARRLREADAKSVQ